MKVARAFLSQAKTTGQCLTTSTSSERCTSLPAGETTKAGDVSLLILLLCADIDEVGRVSVSLA